MADKEQIHDPDELPPSYDSVPADPPPTYDSLFGELRNAREESSGSFEFLKKFVLIILSTIGCSICLGLFLAIPITCIVIGELYKDDCPASEMIPIYLIVAGSFGILRNIIGLFNQIKEKCQDNGEQQDEPKDRKKTVIESLIDTFLFAWFIAGNVWIYRIYEPDYINPASPEYCHQTLYLFAFWITTATYIFIGFLCCCMCCVACCSALVE